MTTRYPEFFLVCSLSYILPIVPIACLLLGPKTKFGVWKNTIRQRNRTFCLHCLKNKYLLPKTGQQVFLEPSRLVPLGTTATRRALLCLVASSDCSRTDCPFADLRPGLSCSRVALCTPLCVSPLPSCLSHPLPPPPLQRGHPGVFGLHQMLPKHPQATRFTFYTERKRYKVLMHYFASSMWDKVKISK